MAIIKGSPVITQQSANSVFTVNLPTYVSGDVWITIMQTRAITRMDAATGWTLLMENRAATSSSGPWISVFYRVPDGSEGNTAAFTTASNPSAMVAAVYPMSGVDTGMIFDGVATNDGSTVAEMELRNDGVVTEFNNTFLFNVQAGALSTDEIIFTEPTGWTKELDINDTYNDLNVNYTTQSVAGPTGAVNGLMSIASRWVSVVFGLKDAAEIYVNQPPIIDAGNEQNVIATAPIILTATASDPENQPMSFLWEKVSGPTEGAIDSPTTQSTSVSGGVVGTYVFQVTVTDSASLTASDQVTVNVAEDTTYPTMYVFMNGTWERRRLYTMRGGMWE